VLAARAGGAAPHRAATAGKAIDELMTHSIKIEQVDKEAYRTYHEQAARVTQKLFRDMAKLLEEVPFWSFCATAPLTPTRAQIKKEKAKKK
jgi:hypothetical protein